MVLWPRKFTARFLNGKVLPYERATQKTESTHSQRSQDAKELTIEVFIHPGKSRWKTHPPRKVQR